MSAYDPTKIKSIRALNDHIIVTDMNFDQKITHGGIIIPSSDRKLEGIHARWARVYAIGPTQSDVRVGQYVLVSHGRWTRGLDVADSEGEKTIRRVDNTDILMVSDEPQQDETIGRGL
jgi:co-chaperonin GroES (HSP10)